jgi:hypothetical protein
MGGKKYVGVGKRKGGRINTKREVSFRVLSDDKSTCAS